MKKSLYQIFTLNKFNEIYILIAKFFKISGDETFDNIDKKKQI